MKDIKLSMEGNQVCAKRAGTEEPIGRGADQYHAVSDLLKQETNAKK